MSTESTNRLQPRNGSTLGRVLDGSKTVSLCRRLERGVVSLGRIVSDPLARSYPHSSIHRFGEALVRATRHSQTYGWLTKEPQHGVIVVDLRETRAVGPIFRPLDRLASSGPARRFSRTRDLLASVLGRPIRRAPVRLASVAVLGLATTALAVTWSSAGTSLRLALLAAMALAAVGLRVDATWSELADSRVGDGIRAFTGPREPEDRPDDGTSR